MILNKKNQSELEEKGFTTIQFIDPSIIEEVLQNSLDIHHMDLGNSIFFSNINSLTNLEYKKNIVELIKKYVLKPLPSLFKDYEYTNGVIVIKNPGVAEFPNHQDWSLVDEDYYTSIGVWCPLIDTNPRNGGFSILPKSHHLPKTFRSSTLDFAYKEFGDWIDENKIDLTIKAGEAVVFNHSCIHSTCSNQTDQPRHAIFFGLRDQNSQLLHHYFNGKEVEEYLIDNNFFYTYDYASRPKGYKLNRLIHSFNQKVSLDLIQKTIL